MLSSVLLHSSSPHRIVFLTLAAFAFGQDEAKPASPQGCFWQMAFPNRSTFQIAEIRNPRKAKIKLK
jgi:hypothetical protein